MGAAMNGRHIFSSPLLLALCACGSSESNGVAANDAGSDGPVEPPPALDAGSDGAVTSRTTLEGPVTGGLGSPWIAATSYDLAEVGYSTTEYFVSGTASAYMNVGDFGSDGRWNAQPAASAPFKTRIVVYRPIDASRFNGSVLVEWLNVSGGIDAAPDWVAMHTELIRQGYAWVGVSAQLVGIEGGGGLITIPGVADTSLKGTDPERYGSLSHPGDSFSYDMFTQVGETIRAPGSVDSLQGLRPERVIAVGESQSAFRLVTYVNAVHPLVHVYDGFLIHSRGGNGAALSQPPEPEVAMPAAALIRDDLTVPVLTFQTETDIITLGSHAARQPDSPLLRLWEVAGTAHADTYTISVGANDRGDDPAAAAIVVTAAPLPGIIECTTPINSGPQHFVLKAAMAALDAWVENGTEPPTAPLLDNDGTTGFVVDEHGNALGGIRTPYVDVPTATLSGLGQTGSGFCVIFGTTVPFDAAKLAALYPTHAEYTAAVGAATDSAVMAGFLLEPDGQLIKAAAAASDVGN